MIGRPSTRATVLLFLVFALIVAGCEPSAPWRKTAPVPVEQQQAQRLAQKGDYAGAAAASESAAASASGDARTALLLSAARYYLLAGDPGGAENILRRTPRPRGGDLAIEYRVVDGELRLARNEPREAVDVLGAAPDRGTPADLRLRYYRVMADALARQQRPVAEADARMRLADLATDAAERNANQQRLLRVLAPLPEDQRTELRRLGHPDAQGWIALADALAGAGGDALERERRYQDWRMSHPNHPAFSGPGAAPFGAPLPAYAAGSALSIGVLLPQDGPYARAAEVIREGIVGALYGLPPEQRPALRFYDSTDAFAAPQAYQQAVNEGANVVIGPLTKDAVASLKQGGLVGVPVLALNQVDDLGFPLPGLFQFAFSPEEEGRQVADRALAEGFRSAAILTPAGAWGTRHVEGFRAQWESMGGIIATITEYNPDEHHFAAPIKSALGSGADFVYVVGKPLKTRQLRTQIQFFGRATTPVFLGAQAVQDPANRAANLDLDGARIPGMPWMLIPAQEPEQSTDPAGAAAAEEQTYTADAAPEPAARLAAVREGIANVEAGYGEFFAMGYDALYVALNLDALSGGFSGIEGATGYLTIDGSGVVRRRPAWLTFVDGHPTPLPEFY